MLKKQTVWLLTMLSLIIVLSVYYMTSPTPSPSNQVAMSDGHQKNKKPSENKKSKETPKKQKKESKKSDEQTSAKAGQGEVTTTAAGQAVFATAELKKENARSRKEAKLTQTIASDKATAEEKAQANAKLDELQHLSSKEKMIESMIVAKGLGKDALVNVDGDQIRIYVEAGSLSNKQAAQILDFVEEKLNMSTPQISVTYNPGKAE